MFYIDTYSPSFYSNVGPQKILAIWIGLGTVTAKVAVWKHSRIEIITVDKDSRAILTYAAFAYTGLLLGREA